jgi:serine/threonine protein kinase
MRDPAEDSGLLSIVLEEGSLLAQKYRLSRPAGFGGMAQLWVAKNEATGAEVCIKILVPEKSDDESVERFRREAYAAARLSHRAIVRIFDLVELGADGEATKGKPAALAIVMELLHGETLGDHLMKRGQLPVEETMDLALPILSALAHAHRAGVVHRDLKPDNIFLATDPDGHVIPKVLDFGVSKVAITGEHALRLKGSTPQPVKALTMDGVMLGTPSFMSPEQARGARDVDARSDVFSAGILMYMMLAGKNPFESESFHAVIAAVLTREPPRPAGVPDPIWQVIEVSLAKESKVRYADATEQGIALRRAAGRATTTDSGVHTPFVLPSSSRKLKTPLGGDSHVSVPPFGSSELGDGDVSGDARFRVPTEASRRRSIRIVAAVLGASVVMMVVALLRGPTGGAAAPSASATRAAGDAPNAAASSVAPLTTAPANPAMPPGAATPATSAEPEPPRGGPAGIATGLGAPAAAADAGAALPPPSATSATSATTAASPPTMNPAPSLPAPPVTAATAAVKKAPPSSGAPLAAPTSTGVKEPSIVRDPGF